MKIGIIGAKGFIGQEIWDRLRKHELHEIQKDEIRQLYYDIVIDANGSSKKFEASESPEYDFKKAVNSVMHNINTLRYDKYIYLSTIDADAETHMTRGGDNYGFNRRIAERLVSYYCSKWTIIRLCSVIGHTASKGIVRDILYGEKIYVKKKSFIQLIPVKEVSKNLSSIIGDRSTDYETLKFYSTKGIKVERICTLFNKNPIVNAKAKLQIYPDSPPSDFGFKTSEEYLKETFHERMV